jgi:hypothetical protein
MARGAVVTGTIFDQNGEPLPSARVTLMRYVFSQQSGDRTLQPFGAAGTCRRPRDLSYFRSPAGRLRRAAQLAVCAARDLRQTTAQSLQSALQQRARAGPEHPLRTPCRHPPSATHRFSIQEHRPRRMPPRSN